MFISRIAREWKTQYPSFDLLQELRTVVLQDNILPFEKKEHIILLFFWITTFGYTCIHCTYQI